MAETLNEFFSKNTRTEQTNVIKNTDLMSNFMHIPSDIRSGCTSLSYTKPTEVREVMSKMKINKAVGHDLIPAGALKSRLKSYAVFLAQDLISSSTQKNVEKRWNNLSPQKGVYPDKRKLQASENTSLAISSFRDTHSQSSQPSIDKIFHKNVFVNHKHHGCNTALLSLTEQWCKELDNRQILGLVSMDLKKLSTIYLPHELTGRNLENMLLTTKPELLLCNLH